MSCPTPYAEKFSVALRNSIQNPYLLECSLTNVVPLAGQCSVKVWWNNDCFVDMLVLLSSSTKWPVEKDEELLIASTGMAGAVLSCYSHLAACQAIVCTSLFHR